MTRSERIAVLRKEHADLHTYCKTKRGYHEAYQRLCNDPCHRAKR